MIYLIKINNTGIVHTIALALAKVTGLGSGFEFTPNLSCVLSYLYMYWSYYNNADSVSIYGTTIFKFINPIIVFNL